LQVCMMLGNRGDRPIKVPIQLESSVIRSPFQNLFIPLEAGMFTTASQMVWDISGSVPDGQIVPGGKSSPFCLSFRFQPESGDSLARSELDLLALKIRVLAGGKTGSP
jgi:hypothetical protein